MAARADVAEDVELAESVSIAMLTVLETLGPTERAVFVLRDVFETPYDEIAEAVGKTPAAVRQIAHRAREHVAARRPRARIDLNGELDTVASLVVEDGRITRIYAIRNPHKLARLGEEAELSR